MSVFTSISNLIAQALSKAQKPKNQGNPQALRDWYNEGAKGQIRWGEEGDFMRCVRIASKYMTVDEAKGFCNKRHQDATGHAPGQGPHSKS